MWSILHREKKAAPLNTFFLFFSLRLKMCVFFELNSLRNNLSLPFLRCGVFPSTPSSHACTFFDLVFSTLRKSCFKKEKLQIRRISFLESKLRFSSFSLREVTPPPLFTFWRNQKRFSSSNSSSSSSSLFLSASSNANSAVEPAVSSFLFPESIPPFSLVPPPPYKLSVHNGYRIQASLCITRLPVLYSEAEYEKEWRLFCERWKAETQNEICLNDEIVYMKYAFQFLMTEEEKKKKKILIEKTGDSQVSELDKMLAQEGLQANFPLLKNKKPQEKTKEGGKKNDHTATEHTSSSKDPTIKKLKKKSHEQKDESFVKSEEADNDKHNIKREAKKCLYLIVKYKKNDKWRLPIVDRIHTYSIRHTLHRLIIEHFGEYFDVNLVGNCPFNFTTKKYPENSLGIEGRKIFYYRGYVIPGEDINKKDLNKNIKDYAWVTRQEIKTMLSVKNFYNIHTGLMLD